MEGFFPEPVKQEQEILSTLHWSSLRQLHFFVPSDIWRCTQASTATLFSQPLPARAVRITQEEAVV